jgi:peptidoglycan/LPS O-acetylase OafA/YrhL
LVVLLADLAWADWYWQGLQHPHPGKAFAVSRPETLFLGCLLALYLQDFTRLVKPGFIRILGVLAFAVLIVCYFRFGYTDEGSLFRWGFPVIGIACAGLIAWLIAEPTSFLARFLSSRPMKYIGRFSYGLYIWQIPLIEILRATSLSAHVQIVLIIFASLAAGALSHQLVEAHFLKAKKREPFWISAHGVGGTA